MKPKSVADETTSTVEKKSGSKECTLDVERFERELADLISKRPAQSTVAGKMTAVGVALTAIITVITFVTIELPEFRERDAYENEVAFRVDAQWNYKVDKLYGEGVNGRVELRLAVDKLRRGAVEITGYRMRASRSMLPPELSQAKLVSPTKLSQGQQGGSLDDAGGALQSEEQESTHAVTIRIAETADEEKEVPAPQGSSELAVLVAGDINETPRLVKETNGYLEHTFSAKDKVIRGGESHGMGVELFVLHLGVRELVQVRLELLGQGDIPLVVVEEEFVVSNPELGAKPEQEKTQTYTVMAPVT